MITTLQSGASDAARDSLLDLFTGRRMSRLPMGQGWESSIFGLLAIADIFAQVRYRNEKLVIGTSTKTDALLFCGMSCELQLGGLK